jgi:hypothetical protein
MAEVKPTPSQEENDLAAMGMNVIEKEPDGSPTEEPPEEQAKTRSHETRAMHAERQPGGRGYETRQVRPRQQPQPEPQPPVRPIPPQGPQGERGES